MVRIYTLNLELRSIITFLELKGLRIFSKELRIFSNSTLDRGKPGLEAAGGVVAQGALSPEYPESGSGGLFSADCCVVDCCVAECCLAECCVADCCWAECCLADVQGGASSVAVSDDEVRSSCI